MRYRAAVLHAMGARHSIEEVELQPLAPSDVLIRLHASGLCHTDLEVIEGALPYPLPIVLGHEGAGVVEQVGAAVTHVKPGDHVVCSWNPHCGHCFYCERDQPILCEPFTRHQPAGRLLDGGSRYRLAGHRLLHHFSTTSTHAQYTVVPESGAIAVPHEIPFDRACLIGCGVMTGVGAAVRLAKVEPGSTAVVVGCGAVGLHAIQGARLQQADAIVAIDRDPARLALATGAGTAALATGRVAAACCARAEGALGAIAAAMAVFFRAWCGRAAVIVLGLSFLMHTVGMGRAVTHRIAGGNLGRGKLDGSRRLHDGHPLAGELFNVTQVRAFIIRT